MSRPGLISRIACLLIPLCAPHCALAAVTDLLFVVGNSGALTSAESTRKTGFESYGYTVTIIDDGASQASFNAAAAVNNVAWVSCDVGAATLNTKLKNVTIGVVNEQVDLADDFGFCTSTYGTSSENFLEVQNNSHYITYGLPLGNNTILSISQTLARRTGTLAAGAVNLANVQRTPGQTDAGLLTLEVGAALAGGGNATGRRVLLPVGGTSFNLSALNNTGISIFLRSIEWAARPNPSLGTVLMPVTNPGALTTQETLRRMQIDVWGYNVSLIDDDASQASYTAAYAGKLAVYASEEVIIASIGTKLLNCPIGVVSEDYNMSDELALSTTSAGVSATAVTIANNTHYITSPFSTGALTIFSSTQLAGTITGTIAPGLETLATIGGAKSLAVVEAGGVLTNSTTAAGRRVQLPWGGNAFDFNAVNASGKTMMRRAIEWAAATVGTRLLMVVNNSNALATQETARKTLLESWGYSVNIIDDDATLANFNLAVGANTVAYVTKEISATSLGTKLTNANIGIVNERATAAPALGIASTVSTSTQSALSVIDGTHYITSVFGVGTTTIFTSAQAVAAVTGTTAGGQHVLGQYGGVNALVTIEEGGLLIDGSTAVGRRVQLPWGDSAFSFSALNANGQTILQRSLQWASALLGHWKLDETSGTIAYDSSSNGNNGTLSGMTFASQSTTGRVSKALSFNGSSHYISINNATSLQPTQALSITAWIKGNSWSSGTTVNTILRKGDTNPNNYQLAVTNGKLEALLNGSDASGYAGQTSLQAGKWYHVAMTWDGTTVKLYVDGQLDNSPSPTKSAPIGTDSRALYIGGRIGSTDFFNGTIDDVRLYNYALGASEVAKIKGIAGGLRIIKWLEVR